ncbi:MAG: signal transduction protein with cbs domain [Anaerolineaceae bacterium]|nr:MAG: signal transduction protein with cbs domain [Anaerolineaceae bacterium]
MRTIKQILKQKGEEIWSINPDTMVFEALQLLAAKDVGALLVMEDGQPVGIFSERDYARKVILKEKSSKETPVREIMSAHLISITPDQTNEQGLALMTARRIRHLPVITGKKLVGFISIGDLVKSIIDEQKIAIDKLEKYASQTGGMS